MASVRVSSGIILLATLIVCTPPTAAETLSLNCSDRYWYPFMFSEHDRVKGILYDIVHQAMESLGIEAKIEPVPYKRAIVNARRGRTDGIIAVAYRSEFTEFLWYPPGADESMESPWRILQVDYVVVTVSGTDYEFEGDIGSLPSPVRVLQGTPIIDRLVRAGLDVQEAREDIQNFLKLIRDKDGAIVTTSVAAETMNRDQRFRGRIRIHATPVASHSYFLAFSKGSRIPRKKAEKLWKEIVRWRDDYVFMLRVFSTY